MKRTSFIGSARSTKKLFEFIVVLFGLVILTSCQQQSVLGSRPLAKDGVLDLRHWDFEKDGEMPLNGEWSFYWQKLYEPADLNDEETKGFSGYINLPGRWNGYQLENGEALGSGFATFRLRIIADPNKGPFALKIRDMSTSYKLWVDNKIVASNGKVGKSKLESVPQFLPNVTQISQESEEINLTLQVSNYRHKKGGVWEPIEFGPERIIRNKRTKNLAFELFLVGSLLVMSFYHFGLFLLRRSDPSTVYFSLVCFLVSIRTLLVGERFLIWLFPDFNWEMMQKIEYLSFYLSIPFFYLFVSSLYPEFSKTVGKVLVIFSILFSAFTLVTPAIIFSHGMIYYQIMMIVFCIYVPIVLTKTIINKREGAVLVAVGIFILSATVFYEILAMNELVYSYNLSSLGLFVFIFVQSVMLSIRFSKAFTMSEILSEELEDKVEERTKGLKKAHEEIVVANKKLKETHAQLVQSQKMEAMGTLAGGIAHEFNNILGTIIGYAEMLEAEVETNGLVKDGLIAISQSGNRAADLVRQILTFSRTDTQELTSMLIQPAIADMLNVIRTTLPVSIKLEASIQHDCNPILANKTQISQILLNLTANAVDAMKPGGGVLKIELFETQLPVEQLPEGFKPGSYLKLSVSDSGTGMNDEVKNRIFDPFYTTKDVNEGTGLGLSIVHGIVKSHFGFIDVDSQPGKGARFFVYFPVTEEKIASISKADTAPVKGTGHILIVEDDQDLSNFYRIIIKNLGYQASVFLDGVEALDNFKAQPNLYDLVFTDQMMPKLTGFDMSLEMLKIRPEIPIIITTGYSPTVSIEEAQKAGIKHFMTKPVRISELSHKISELI